jgi:hypothetical protein
MHTRPAKVWGQNCRVPEYPIRIASRYGRSCSAYGFTLQKQNVLKECGIERGREMWVCREKLRYIALILIAGATSDVVTHKKKRQKCLMGFVHTHS